MPAATLHEHALFDGNPILGGVHDLTTSVEPHAHDFVEVAVIGGGSGRHVTSCGERRLRRGDVIVLRPGAWHGFADCRHLVVANCCISAQALRKELGHLHQVPAFHRLLWTEPVAAGSHGIAVTQVDPDAAAEAVDAIGSLAQHLASAASRRRPGRTLGQLVTVLGILTDGRQPEPVPQVHPAVAATLARLEADPVRAWRLDDLAYAVNLDPDYLGRLFRRDVGLTPLGYLARVRAEQAANLLAHSDLPVTRVGAAVGWEDPTYFARRFRALVGLSPTEYRRRSRPGRATS
ncbi:MAG TPA: AraC family transcriptional regulator [Actinopolymorphaceae bacterium]|jgi:AraC family L-rhamnose operon transcriptional activator RhaR